MNTVDFKGEVLNSRVVRSTGGVREGKEGELVSENLNNKNQLQSSKNTAWESTLQRVYYLPLSYRLIASKKNSCHNLSPF